MSFGYGSSGFGQNNQPGGTFGSGFGNNNGSNPVFGVPSAFGAPATTTPGGGLFGGGSAAATTGGFGGPNPAGAFGAPANTGFGAKPAFGTPSTSAGGGSVFGTTTTATTAGSGFGGGGFGNNVAPTASPFGGTPASVFASNASASPFGGLSNATPVTAPSLFGGTSAYGGTAATNAFGAPTNNPGIGTNVGDPPGTAVLAFSPLIEKEANSSTQNSFQNLLFQEPYKKFSAEELRMADYAQGRQYGNGPAGGGGAFGTTGFGTGFGNTAQNTGFGTPSTGVGLFATNQNNSAATAFGNTTNTGGFGAAGGLFGQDKTATGASSFGGPTSTTQPAQTGGLFATTGNTSGFGTGTAGGSPFGNNNQDKPTGFGTGFGGTTTESNAFGNNAAAANAFGQNANNAGLFGGNNAQGNPMGGGLFGHNQQQAQQGTGFGGGGSFGQNSQQPGGGLFGDPNKPSTSAGAFGNALTQQSTGLGAFGANNATSTGFGQTNPQQLGGGLFGQAKPATSGSIFGAGTTEPQTSGGLFAGLGTNTQNQQQQNTNSLFGGLSNQNQLKPSAFGSTTQFGSQPTLQQSNTLFGQSTAQQLQQNSILGGSLFNNSQNAQSAPQILTASINDVNAYGIPPLFSGLAGGEVQNPGPLATPLSGKKKERKGSVLPMWKLNPASATKFVTPVKRGYGFSYSTYGSPATPPSASSTPGGLSQTLQGTGNLNRSLAKSFSSSSLRKSFNSEDSILSPGSFSSSMGTRSYGSAALKKLNIDKSLRFDLFSSPSKDKPVESPQTLRKLSKRVSFDTGASTPDARTLHGTREASIILASTQDFGFIRPTNRDSATADNNKTGHPDPVSEMEQVRGNELAVVHEESSAAYPAAARLAASTTNSGTAGAYWMSPTKEEISKINRMQRSQVNDFTVGRENVGQVRFKAPVDLTNIDLDEIPGQIVVLEIRSCTVYPVSAKKPAVGKGLNVPAVISLEHSWPRGRDKRTPLAEKSGRAFNKHVERFKKIPGTKFIDYNADTGVWTFEVEHFTTYGLNYDEEDDSDGESNDEIILDKEAALSSQPKSSSPTDGTSPCVEIEDTCESRRNRRSLPGAFDCTGAFSDDEKEIVEDDEPSFLSSRPAGPASQALGQHDDEEMDEEHALSEDQDASAYFEYHQAAGLDYDSPQQGSLVKYQEMPGGILRARMRAVKDSNTPLSVHVAGGDDWMEMLQKTIINPAKRNRSALKTLNEEEVYDDLKTSARLDALQAKSIIIPDGHGFATSIELLNSLFEKSKAPARPVPAHIPTSGSKWPYKRQDKNALDDEANLTPADRTFRDTIRPSWGPDGMLVISTVPKTIPTIPTSALDKDGIMTVGRFTVVSQARDIRFARFVNETSPKALNNQMALTCITVLGGVPTISLDRVTSLTAFFHAQHLQNAANAHEKMVWDLASLLYDDVKEADGASLALPSLSRARHRKLSVFWQSIVENASHRAVGMARSPEDKAIASLSGHQIPDACKHLLDGKNFRLATLVSLIGTSDQLMQDIKEQVKVWRDAKLLSEFTEPIRAIYELLGGNVCAVEGMKGAIEDRMESFIISQRFGLDWKQAFGLRLWYGSSSKDDLVQAIHSFEEDIQQGKEARPRPWFAEQGIPALWDDPDKDLREDLLWGLLKLYANKEAELADILRPENSELSPLNSRLSWQLSQALVGTGKVSFGKDADEKADALTLAYASQLTNDKYWLEAVFVLLHLKDPRARVRAIQDHLCRHTHLIRGEQGEEFTTLTHTFKIPATWIWQAKALYMRSVKKDPRQEVLYLLRAAACPEAHRTFTKHVAPLAVIEKDYDGLRTLLSEFGDRGTLIPDWNLGGRIYRDFLELVRHVEYDSVASIPAQVVEGLLAGLPALQESIKIRQDADVLEVAALADMANIVAKVVVEMAKKGETSISQVLSLPLTEDAHLRYSKQLAFAYYESIMSGRA